MKEARIVVIKLGNEGRRVLRLRKGGSSEGSEK
jgi:hypothetical protein